MAKAERPTKLYCPGCGRFLGEISTPFDGRIVCGECGGEVIYRDKLERRKPLLTVDTMRIRMV